MSEQVSTEPSALSTRVVSRTRGATSGILLVILGAWGALIPFIGPSFGWGWNSDQSWHWTAARGWYEVLPGALAIAAGLVMLVATSRMVAMLGALLGALAGGWFVIGLPLVSSLTLGSIGAPTGGKITDAVAPQTQHALKELTYFYLVGALIIFLSAIAFGRLSVVSVRDVQHAERLEAERAEAERLEAERAQAEFEARRRAAEREEAELREAADRAVAEREEVNRFAAERGYGPSPYGSSEDTSTGGSGYDTFSGYGSTSSYGTQTPTQSPDTEESRGYGAPPENRG